MQRRDTAYLENICTENKRFHLQVLICAKIRVFYLTKNSTKQFECSTSKIY